MRSGPEAPPPSIDNHGNAAGCQVRGVERETHLRVGNRQVPVDGISEFPAAISAESRVWPCPQGSRTLDAVAEEVPVALAYNGVSHAVMMATPANLVDFAVGFTLSEGIVESLGEVHDVRMPAPATGRILA